MVAVILPRSRRLANLTLLNMHHSYLLEGKCTGGEVNFAIHPTNHCNAAQRQHHIRVFIGVRGSHRTYAHAMTWRSKAHRVPHGTTLDNCPRHPYTQQID